MNKFRILALLLILCLCSGCGLANNKKISNIKVNLYFVDSSTNTLKSEEREVKDTDNTQIVQDVLNELVKGPKSQKLLPSIASSVKILGGSLNDDVIEIDVSNEYLSLKARDELFLRGALVFTLTDLEFIQAVKITVEGNDLLIGNGTPMGYVKKEDIVIDSESITHVSSYTREITLYFSDTDALKLVPQNRQIDVNSNQSIEKYIVEQIILGPDGKDLIQTVPKETKIRDVETRDNICYVDLSNDFILKLTGGTSSESLAIYSIVNSLTELNNVKKVQFLIEGEKLQNSNWHFDISKPFERTEY